MSWKDIARHANRLALRAELAGDYRHARNLALLAAFAERQRRRPPRRAQPPVRRAVGAIAALAVGDVPAGAGRYAELPEAERRAIEPLLVAALDGFISDAAAALRAGGAAAAAAADDVLRIPVRGLPRDVQPAVYRLLSRARRLQGGGAAPQPRRAQ